MLISNFKVVVVGVGVQGQKRAKIAKNDLIATVDVDTNKADYQCIEQIDDTSYHAVLLCTPDNVKYELLKKLLYKNKHVLVEKPLFVNNIKQISELERIAKKNNLVLYTAYNHRFEPHFNNMKNCLFKEELGKIYRIRMSYGNGTSGLVKKSNWRDKGSGVILDIGSHLLDTLYFWFKDTKISLTETKSFCFENKSPDYAILIGRINNIFFELEVSLLNWRNDFVCEIIGNNGSAHIRSLCKWGPSEFIKRKRIFPAGRPKEKVITLTQPDPTWELEYQFFKNLVKNKVETNLSRDKKIFNLLKKSFI